MASIGYFDCFSGASGDMILGALIDVGADPEAISSELEKLNIEGWQLSASRVTRQTISATKLQITVTEKPTHRAPSDIIKIISDSSLDQQTKELSIDVFRRLAEAESRVHSVPPEDVEFHEVGAVDAIIDIVGSIVGIRLLGLDKLYCSPLSLGSGIVKTAHGELPIPAPAVVELIKGFPVRGTGIDAELLTPTGSAILTTLCEPRVSLPPMKVLSVGYGAGTRELDCLPNCLRLFVGESARVETEVVVLEANIDDSSPEVLGNTVEKLLSAGALDVFITPVQMKKNRPGVLLSVIAKVGEEESFAKILFRETSTFGVRYYRAERFEMERQTRTIKTSYGEVRLKIGRFQGIVTVSPEFEDCRRLAEQHNLPLREIYHEALRTLSPDTV